MDLVLHYVAGLMVYVSFSFGGTNPEYSLGMTAIVGGAKEVYDVAWEKRRADGLDAAATALGGLTAYGVDRYIIRKAEK